MVEHLIQVSCVERLPANLAAPISEHRCLGLEAFVSVGSTDIRGVAHAFKIGDLPSTSKSARRSLRANCEIWRLEVGADDSGPGMRICIFERNEARSYELQQIAAALGHSPSIAFNLHALLHRFGAEVVDVLLVGANMLSEGDEKELAWLKAVYPETAVIVLALSAGERVALAQEQGTADKILELPVSRCDLHAALQSLDRKNT